LANRQNIDGVNKRGNSFHPRSNGYVGGELREVDLEANATTSFLGFNSPG